ncbi:hypothetical protein U9M48_040367 [Paspalum notatum var. saurae]|uniref:GAG-pre-integrase domain-containing protein n=1 Tax=Paspalum notatum var. saurae TaxID=547442 RepID=A0AAQ3XDN7_PASNO
MSLSSPPVHNVLPDLQTRLETLRYASDGDLYTFPIATSSSAAQAHLAVSPTVWHQHLGHPAPATLVTLQNTDVISYDFSHFCWMFLMKRKSEVFQLITS